jgi:polyisoprenoid-binding protein YceI
MNKTLILFSTIFVLFAFVTSIEWKITNKNDVKILFQLVNEGTKGSFNEIETTILFDKKNLKESKIKAIVNVKSLSTENKGRDEHLLNPDFFDSEKYPTITFESTEIKSSEKGFVAIGNLTMKEKTQTIEIPFEFSEDDKGKANFNGKMQISPFQYEVIKNKKGENELVNVTIEVPLSK